MVKKQFIYVLKLIPEFTKEENWTEKENEIIDEHFKALQKLEQEGKLILAGKTINMDEENFGIVILTANSEEEARIIMENDPGVKKCILSAKLYPYDVALISEKNLK